MATATHMPLALDSARAALLLVEMQNDIVHESNVGKRGRGGVLAEEVQKRGVTRTSSSNAPSASTARTGRSSTPSSGCAALGGDG